MTGCNPAYCPGGLFKQDENGCQICECLHEEEEPIDYDALEDLIIPDSMSPQHNSESTDIAIRDELVEPDSGN